MHSLCDRKVRALSNRIIRCLAERYRCLTGIALNTKLQVSRARDAVVPTVPAAELERSLADVRRGSGGELTPPKSVAEPDFHSVRSSCALAVSVFGPWRLQPGGLTLSDTTGFTKLRFEVKFPILDAAREHRVPPNVDLVCWAEDRVLAVESKFVEQIDPTHRASFASSYEVAINAADPSWRAKVAQLRAKPNAYRFFHAAQIVKHYLGLKADRPSLIRGQPTTLLYLYWEPEDPHAHPFFAAHEAEVRDFAEGLRDDVVSFAYQSYRDLWNDWKRLASPIVQRHVAALEARYLLNASMCLSAPSNVPAEE
jgi:restriction endonuclease-like protein